MKVAAEAKEQSAGGGLQAQAKSVENGRSFDRRAAGAEGFGSQLIARSVAEQLAGKLDYDWQKSGLVVTARMRLNRLAN